MKRFIFVFALIVISAHLYAAEPLVTLSMNKSNNQVDVKIGKENFTTFNYDKRLPKPYFWPVRGPGEINMTRELAPLGYQRPKDRNAKRIDHPHHRGIWVAVDQINNIAFWAEDEPIVNQSVKILATGSNPGRLEVVNHWVDKAGKIHLVETTQINIYANRLLTYKINLAAGKEKLHIGDTKEGLFGFRMVDSMREKGGDGTVVNSAGMKGTSACWGKEADWIDYYGTVEGKTLGVAIFDNPKNFRRSRYHVRNYGLFTISPFGNKAYTNGKSPELPVDLAPGKSLTLRYAMYIHAGSTQAAEVAKVYNEYLKLEK